MKDDSDTLKKKEKKRKRKEKKKEYIIHLSPSWASLEVFAFTLSHHENSCGLIEKMNPKLHISDSKNIKE